MKLEVIHDMLVLGPELETCKNHALHFLHKTPLVQYDTVEVIDRKCVPATDPVFWEKVDKAIARNRETLQELMAELRGYGYKTIEDVFGMEQGFQSKLLHTATHMLDGFIGIDSRFYSLVHDSNCLTEEQRREISESSDEYWLLRVRGVLSARGGSGPGGLRSFEVGG